MKKIRKHIAGIIILSLVMVMGTKTFTAETKKNGTQHMQQLLIR